MGADPRFFRRLDRLTAQDIAGQLGSGLAGDADSVANDVGAADRAEPGELVFITSPVLPDALRSRAGIVIGPALKEPVSGLAAGMAYITHASPKAAFALIAPQLLGPLSHTGSEPVSIDARVDPAASLAPGVVVGPGTVIEAGAVIGANAVIGPGVVVGEGTQIGAAAVIHCTVIGRDCRIGPGTVIGEAGFGIAPGPNGLVDLPHFGRVRIGNEVRVGANCTIDRGMFGDTILRDRVRIDNLCHIAHNVDVGEDTLMAAFAGVSGSVKIGRGAQFGGRVGIVDHVTIGDGARLAASAAAAKNVPPGETWAGIPAQPIQRWLRELALLKKLNAEKPRRVDGADDAGQDSKQG